MPITDPLERRRTERLIVVLDETIERLNLAYSFLLTDRVVDAFGTDYVGDEDQKSIETEPELRRIAAVLDYMDKRVRKARADLADDGSKPPF